MPPCPLSPSDSHVTRCHSDRKLLFLVTSLLFDILTCRYVEIFVFLLLSLKAEINIRASSSWHSATCVCRSFQQIPLIISGSQLCSFDLFATSSGDWDAARGWQLLASSFSTLSLDICTSSKPPRPQTLFPRSLSPSLGEVRRFWERMRGTAGPHHFSLWARERRR